MNSFYRQIRVANNNQLRVQVLFRWEYFSRCIYRVVHIHKAAALADGRMSLVSGLISLVMHITTIKSNTPFTVCELEHVRDPNYISKCCGDRWSESCLFKFITTFSPTLINPSMITFYQFWIKNFFSRTKYFFYTEEHNDVNGVKGHRLQRRTMRLYYFMPCAIKVW